MRMLDLIEAKKRGQTHSPEELAFLVRGVTDGSIPDYQLAAWLMAVCWQGMEDAETAELTLRMQHSGETMDLSAIGGKCVDKHSTGGVADTTTLVLVPLVAACGAKVAKMSGRGLGFTGGTVDKMESIPGMRTELPIAAFIDQVRRIGCAVVGQSAELAPADKRLYGLRDVTGTVDSLPLIASSIMSKKLAAGNDGIVLDVKTGSGALMPTTEASIELARVMVEIGAHAGKGCTALVTDMGQPLGDYIGNALEVQEAIEILSGEAKEGDLLLLSLELGKQMLCLAKVAPDALRAEAMLREALRSGAGLSKLREMIAAQGGDAGVVDDPTRLPQAQHKVPVLAQASGYITAMDTASIGGAAQKLGAGRESKDDVIDPAVGIVLQKRIGDSVAAGEALCTLHLNDRAREAEVLSQVGQAIHIGAEKPEKTPLVHAIVRADGIDRF